MKPLTTEWVSKAEGDWTTAQRELRARKASSYDASCFHAQQRAEKYLKARLQEAGITFGKTHNLSALLKLAMPVEPLWEHLRPSLHLLTEYAVEVRYPGETADKAMARAAVAECRKVRRCIRAGLGMPE